MDWVRSAWEEVNVMEELGALVFVISTGLMLVLIRLIGETFGSYIAVFLPCMFTLQVITIGVALLVRHVIKPAAPASKKRNQAVPTAPGLLAKASSLDAAPWQHPALWIMACLLTMNAAGVFATSKFIAGPVQTVIGASPLVFAPLFDWLLLGNRVSILQMVGVAVCLAGILVGLFTSGAATAGGDTNILAAMVMMAAMAITPALGIMKEAWFRPRPTWHPLSRQRPDILYNVLFYTAGQVPWHLAFIPMVYGPVGMPAFSDMAANFREAGHCIFGGDGPFAAGTNCELVPWLVLVLGVVTATQITTSFYVSVKKSGAYGIILAAVAPFLADAVFGVRLIMGRYTEAVSVWLWLSLVLTVVGLGLYRYGEATTKMTPQSRADSISSVATLSEVWSPEPTWFLTTFLGAPNARAASRTLSSFRGDVGSASTGDSGGEGDPVYHQLADGGGQVPPDLGSLTASAV